MRSIQLSVLALAAAQTVHSYVDTSPFFLFSTSELLNSATKLSSAESITSEISKTLSSCPSDYYIIISQPGVTASDYSSHRTTPALAQRLSSKNQHNIRSSISIPDVFGEIDSTQWRQTLKSHCGVEVVDLDATTGSLDLNTPWSKGVMVTMAAPSSTATALDDLFRNDLILNSILDMLPRTDRGSNYTVLYTTSPAVQKTSAQTEPVGGYVMDSEAQELLHMDMKRDLGSRAPKIVGNQTIIDGPLFEKYQFFTPGIFMGGLVSLLLLSILYVGLSALSSLSVTYAAFDKEQGQLAKSKAQ